MPRGPARAPASSSSSRAIERLLEEGWRRGLENKPMVSHPVISTSLQEPVIVLAEPVKPGDGKVQGVVLVVASLGPLWTSTREMGQEGLFDVYVVDGRGHLVAHSDPKPPHRRPRRVRRRDRPPVPRVPRARRRHRALRPRHAEGQGADARHLRLRARHRVGRLRAGRDGQGLLQRDPDGLAVAGAGRPSSPSPPSSSARCTRGASRTPSTTSCAAPAAWPAASTRRGST